MDVQIVIPTYNRPVLLEKTLRSLAASDLSAVGSDVGVTVVENGSCVSEEVVRRYELAGRPFLYRHLAVGNKSLALNTVVQDLADETLILFLDDDLVLEGDALALLLRVAFKLGPGHYFGGPVQSYYESPPPAYLIPHVPESAGTFRLAVEDEYADIGAIRQNMLGAFWAVYARDLRRAGGFDAAYGPGSKRGLRGQETDAMRRLFSAGCRPIYVRDAVVHHFVPDRVMTEAWLLDRHYKTRLYAGAKRRTPSILAKEFIRIPIAYLSIVRGAVTGRPADRFAGRLLAAKARGYFTGFGLGWLVRGL